MTKQRFIQIYTGDGKGKTSAAYGMAVRSLCAGHKVFIAQFVVNLPTHENKLAEKFDNLTIKQFGNGCFINRKPNETDIEFAQIGLKQCSDFLESGEYDLVILDELNIAIFYNLITVDNVLEMLQKRHPQTEVIITGRYAPKELIDVADLVTNMQNVKHYYEKGVIDRDGFD